MQRPCRGSEGCQRDVAELSIVAIYAAVTVVIWAGLLLIIGLAAWVKEACSKDDDRGLL